MFWINFLHFYQPLNIESTKIKEATEKCYQRVIRGLEENKTIKFTLNISGCLLIRLEEGGYFELLKKTKTLINEGRIELVGSNAYHTILPLTPKEEIIRSVKENEAIIKKFFGNIKLKGFYFPEMAINQETIKTIKELGYEWTILDPISTSEKIHPENIYQDKYSELKIIFRNHRFSRTYAPDLLQNLPKDFKQTIITATDGELYGLRHEDPTGEFENILKKPNLRTMTISEYLNKQATKPINIRPSSWESTERELKRNLPYVLWYNPKNEIHLKLWALTGLIYYAYKNYQNDKEIYWMRWHMVRGIASCTYWWASGKNFKEHFGPIAWGPDDILRGANELIRAIRCIHNKKSIKLKLKAEKIYNELCGIIWNTHWKKQIQ